MSLPSTRAYLIRALHEWCCDHGFTPYITVVADEWARVPREFVRDGHIVLNIDYEATNRLSIGNEDISFQARFGGVPRDILIPVGNVVAIYARENGHGMAFEYEKSSPAQNDAQEADQKMSPDRGAGAVAPKLTSHEGRNGDDGHDDDGAPLPPSGRPKLQRIK